MRNLYVLLLIFICFSAAAQGLITKRVFGPEHPGPYKHPASITELANGDLYIAYYGGSGEYSDDTAVFGSRLAKGADEWEMPKKIADTPYRSEGNPVVWQAPDGNVWLFYVNNYGETWSDAIVKCKISEDGARTWTDPIVMSFEPGSMVQGQPIVLNSGEYLLPMYHEKGGDTEMSAADTMSYFFRINPETMRWKATGRIWSEMGNLQPHAVQLSDDHLIAYMRRGGDYEPTDDGWTLRADSFDGGESWTDAKRSQFKNPNAAICFIQLANGHLLLVYNDHMYERTPLTVAVSTDKDKTYPYRKNIAEGDNTFAYPYAIQTSDEMIHVVYTTNSRTTIMHAVFDEHFILADENEE